MSFSGSLSHSRWLCVCMANFIYRWMGSTCVQCYTNIIMCNCADSSLAYRIPQPIVLFQDMKYGRWAKLNDFAIKSNLFVATCTQFRAEFMGSRSRLAPFSPRLPLSLSPSLLCSSSEIYLTDKKEIYLDHYGQEESCVPKMYQTRDAMKKQKRKSLEHSRSKWDCQTETNAQNCDHSFCANLLADIILFVQKI